VLQDPSIDDIKSKPPDCTCISSSFIYNPTGHVITGDLKIINTVSLRDVFAKGRKYREPKSINWKHIFTIFMDSVADYNRKWTKRERTGWRVWGCWYKLDIKNLNESMCTRTTSIFKDPNVAKHLSPPPWKILCCPRRQYCFVCKSYYVGRVWRYQRGNQNPYIEEQTTQWICRLIDQGIWYWQFTCQPYKYILDNHKSVLCSFGISTKDEKLDLPSL